MINALLIIGFLIISMAAGYLLGYEHRRHQEKIERYNTISQVQQQMSRFRAGTFPSLFFRIGKGIRSEGVEIEINKN
jgi:hypothetical protein